MHPRRARMWSRSAGVLAVAVLLGSATSTVAASTQVEGAQAAADEQAAVGSQGTSERAARYRNPFKRPFSSKSIWNTSIGTGAQYVHARLSTKPRGDVWAPMPMVDEEHIVLKPTAPLTRINYSSAGWGGNRCASSGGTLASVPIPSTYVVPNDNDNASSAFLLADGRSIIQTRPFARCSPGGSATSLVTFPKVDIYGDGISGSHGGSSLSAIGGSLRVGELRPGRRPPRHALKVLVDAAVDLARCSTNSACFRWPATAADSYAVGHYGSYDGSSPAAMKMGALLALPQTMAIKSIGLETEPGRKIARTLKRYGAYIVDDSYGGGFGFAAEDGPDGSFTAQFQSDWGMSFVARVNDNSAWMRDVQRIVARLAVVNNNGPSSVGGGGTPLMPPAAPLRPPG